MLLDQILPKETGLFYGGDFHTNSQSTLNSLNPATGEHLLTVSQGSENIVDKVVKVATDAQSSWAALDIQERVYYIRRFMSAIQDSREALAILDSLDTGNPLTGMQLDIKISLAVMELFVGLAPAMKGETFPGSANRLNFTIREPLGVVARIIPFNHPLMFVCIKSVAPLIAGNTIIIKPSEATPLSSLRIAEIVAQIFPPGVFNIINGDKSVGSALARHPSVRNVSLVGSIETGEAVLRDASHSIKSTLLELGGKNPLIVCKDTDINFAAEQSVKGMNLTWTAGQSCGSTSRLLVHASHYDALVDEVTQRFEMIKLGMPVDAQTQMGCLTTLKQFNKVKNYLEIGRQEGGRMTTGGIPDHSPHPSGLFVMPTIFADVTPKMRVAREEIFGPVLSILKWQTESELLEIVNSLRYGLTAGVITNDINQGLRLTKKIEAGYVWINNSSDHYPGVPFGGYKSSGLGREECLEELLEFTQIKAINISIREL